VYLSKADMTGRAVPYDDMKYVESLKRNNNELYAWIIGQRLGIFLIRSMHFTQFFRELFELLASGSLPRAA
jgi:hypothetical protein